MGNRTREIARVPKVEGLSPVYFIELELAASDGKPVSRNVYWLSTKADVLNWEASNWYLTPLAQYGDFTALRALPAATSQASAGTVRDGDDAVTTVTLSVPPTSPAVALQQHVSIRRGPQGDLALPIVWSDNDVTLWPGESIVLTARYPWTDGADPVVEVTGWNLAQGTDH
jgi:exo-1,4-beta-D-glucosaminidase